MRAAYENIMRSREDDHRKLEQKANATPIKEGDRVAVRVEDKTTLEPRYDSGHIVTRVRGQTAWVLDQNGKSKTVPRERLVILPPEADLEQVAKRLTRTERLKAEKLARKGVVRTRDEVPEEDNEDLALQHAKDHIEAEEQEKEYKTADRVRAVPRPTAPPAPDRAAPEGALSSPSGLPAPALPPTGADTQKDLPPLPDDDEWPPTPPRPTKRQLAADPQPSTSTGIPPTKMVLRQRRPGIKPVSYKEEEAMDDTPASLKRRNADDLESPPPQRRRRIEQINGVTRNALRIIGK